MTFLEAPSGDFAGCDPFGVTRSGTGVPPVRIVQPTHGRDARATTAENQTPGIQRYTRTLPQDEGEACRALRILILPGAAPPDVHLRRRLLFLNRPRRSEERRVGKECRSR